MNPDRVCAEYERDGVVRVRQFLFATEVKRIRREIEHYMRDIAPKLEVSEVTFEADGKTARNLWRMEKHSPFFSEAARKPEILDLVREITHLTQHPPRMASFHGLPRRKILAGAR